MHEANLDLFLTKELNEQQRQAVLQKDGACLVIAGAGSGKTRVITSRIAYLLSQEQESPEGLVALTFTNKAANEMKKRVSSFLGRESTLPFVGTFHSYCLLLLRRDSEILTENFSGNFSILDADDQEALIKRILKKYSLVKHISVSQVIYSISIYKNSLIGPAYSPRDNKDFNNYTGQRPVSFPQDNFSQISYLKEIYSEYELEKANSHAFDFDDLILQVLNIFKNNKNFKEKYQNRLRHLLVDEYQDTNRAQHELLKQLALTQEGKFAIKSLCVVGDEDQSIYSWRGATVKNILMFQSDFAPVKVIKIEQNYRSVSPILDLANKVISHNNFRNPKNLWSLREAKNRIFVCSCRTERQEALMVSNFIEALRKTKSIKNIAIVYRAHYQSRAIEEVLLRNSINYKIFGGIQFYERKEIKDLLAYMRLIINPYDKISLLRIINCPSRGLGEKFEAFLLELWGNNIFLNFIELLELILSGEKNKLSHAKSESLEKFLLFYKNFFAKDFKNNIEIKPSGILNEIIEFTDYFSYLREEYDAYDAESKIENIYELEDAINYFEGENENPTLESFLYEVALVQEKLKDSNDKDYVSLMTLHAAKGLEFDAVIITGLDEGILPHSKSLTTIEALEEERRLFYVGVTRAKEYLILLNAMSRYTFGQSVDQMASRFLSEFTESGVSYINCENIYSDLDLKDIVTQKLGGKNLSQEIITYGRSASKNIIKNINNNTNKNNSISMSDSLFNKNDRVTHKKFGDGIILGIEGSEGDRYLTIVFKIGVKKILSSFVQKL